MDAMDALDVVGKRNVELVAQVKPEQKDAIYAYGWFKPPAKPLPESATSLERLIHLVGR